MYPVGSHSSLHLGAMRLFFLMLFVSCSLALKCHDGVESYTTTVKSDMKETTCGRNEVCGKAPHQRGVAKMCVTETMCEGKFYRVFTSYASLYCCGDKDLCNGANAIPFVGFFLVHLLL